MHAGFVREGAVAHERLLGVRADIRHLVDKLCHGFQLLQAVLVHALETHLEDKVRDDGYEVGIADPLSKPVDRALHMHCAALDRFE